MNLEKLRKEKNLTQIEAAIALSVSLSSYRMWEAGVTKPSEENYVKLCELFGEKNLKGE